MISSSRPVLFLVLFLAQIVEPIPARAAGTHYHTLKVCGSNVTILLNWTLLFEWYMARFVVKNAHEKRCMCYKEIELCAQNILTTGTIGRVCDHWIRRTIFTWTSYNHSNSETWNDDLYAWPDELIPKSIQQLKLSMELDVPRIGPHTLWYID